MIEIELLTPDREHEFRHFLRSNPRALIYPTLEFRDFLGVVAGGEPNYWLALRQGRICGVLPYFSRTVPGYGRIINSLMWYGSYGGCTLASEEDAEARRALLEKYSAAATSPDVVTATLIASPFEHEWEAQYREVVKPEFTDQRIGQITPLPERGSDVAERLMRVLSQKTRNLVRKSLKQDFELSVTNDEWAWQFLYATHMENMLAINGRAKLWEHFVAMQQEMPLDWRRILVARLKGQPVAAILLLTFNQTVEYITPVIKHDYRSQQPLSFLIWHGMLQAIAEGYRYWNWGGTWSAQKTLHHFKAGWGAVDYPYTYLINATAGSVQTLKAHLKELHSFAPYYYLFPYKLLS